MCVCVCANSYSDVSEILKIIYICLLTFIDMQSRENIYIIFHPNYIYIYTYTK